MGTDTGTGDISPPIGSIEKLLWCMNAEGSPYPRTSSSLLLSDSSTETVTSFQNDTCILKNRSTLQSSPHSLRSSFPSASSPAWAPRIPFLPSARPRGTPSRRPATDSKPPAHTRQAARTSAAGARPTPPLPRFRRFPWFPWFQRSPRSQPSLLPTQRSSPFPWLARRRRVPRGSGPCGKGRWGRNPGSARPRPGRGVEATSIES